MPYEPFPCEGSSTSGSSEGGFAKIVPSFFFLLVNFFFFFLFSFFWGGLGWVVFFVGFFVVFFVVVFFFLGGGVGGSGTPWVVTCATSWLLPDNTGSLWEISNFGGGYKPSLLFSIAQMKTPCDFKL